MTTTTRSGALLRTMIGVPTLVSVVAAWFVVHVRGRSVRDRDELAMEGTDLDDSATALSAVEAREEEELDEATAVVLG